MSINDFLVALSQYQWALVCYFVALPLLSFLLRLGYKPYAYRDFRAYAFSTLIYLASIPGIFSGMLLFYTTLILRKSLLEVNLILYFLPVVSMAIVYLIIGKATDVNQLPGFGRLSGLMLMLFLVCLCLFFLYRLHFIIGFFGSIEFLLGAAVVLFVLFKMAANKMKGQG